MSVLVWNPLRIRVALPQKYPSLQKERKEFLFFATACAWFCGIENRPRISFFFFLIETTRNKAKHIANGIEK